METVNFLCGSFYKIDFIYAIKNDLSDWYYFKEEDSLLDEHVSLPPNLINEISRLKKLTPIAVTLNPDQIVNYVNNGKFIFKGKELTTCKLCLRNQILVSYFKFSRSGIELSGITASHREKSNPRKKGKSKSTDDLVFEAGKTNPAIFLKEFEKCYDVKTEKDKLYKLRNFVNENDRPEFSTLFFKSDWQRARSIFLKKYSLDFTENKKKKLCFSFEEERSLRSFVTRKMNALTMYTTLSVQNQLEVILELPNEIANFFILEDKLNSTKAEILEFCDLVQEYSDSNNTRATSPTTNSDVPSDVIQELEIFDFQEVDSLSDTGSTSTDSSVRGKVKRCSRSVRPVKIPRTISEELETSTNSDSNQMDE